MAPPLRVLQWNVLADGLSDDGFLLTDGLEQKQLLEMFTAIAKAKAANSLDSLKAQFETPEAKEFHASMVSWERRWKKMQETIEHLKPDVMTFQELDHMAEAQGDLAKMGYVCAMHDKKYSPLHLSNLGQDQPEQYIRLLQDSGIAFAPNFPSTCRRFGLKKRESADDDGCAIFWKATKFTATALDWLPRDRGRYAAAVRVDLRRKDGLEFRVVCTHLGSGDKEKDEAARLLELRAASFQGQSLSQWIRQSMAEAPTVLCLDANSAPDRAEPDTVWKLLRGMPEVGGSVWDEHFATDGTASGSMQLVPVTTNKMRGPLSQQPHKIGEHMYHIIDHIFFSPSFKLSGHVCMPLKFHTKEDARLHLLPSTDIPSDHAPVVVDLVASASAESWCQRCWQGLGLH